MCFRLFSARISWFRFISARTPSFFVPRVLRCIYEARAHPSCQASFATREYIYKYRESPIVSREAALSSLNSDSAKGDDWCA